MPPPSRKKTISPKNGADYNAYLVDKMAEFFDDPLGFVMFAYPWNEDPTLQMVELPLPWAERYDCAFGPDAWSCEFLDHLGDEVRARGFVPGMITAVDPIREGIVSGHGIGKSALVGWLVDWIMSTRPMSQGTVTANTSKQLETKTWAQIAKWTKRCITAHWFTVSTGRGSMAMRHRKHRDEWFCTAQTCDVENSEAFAGQHAANATSFYIFDEASGIDDEIDRVSEGGLTDGEPMKFAFGNGTQNSGWFYRIFNSDIGRRRWCGRHIDSRNVQITNKKFLNDMVSDYGENSDMVKIRVRGMFPKMSALQFFNGEDVDRAYGREMKPAAYSFAPKILTLDNAWWGDDESVIGLRQGLAFKILRVFPKNDNDIEVANLLARLEDEHKADAVFIDFGYGTGVFSAGKTMGREWRLVNNASESPKQGFLNMRAYCYSQCKEWLKQGGAFPRDSKLYDDFYNVMTVPRLDGKVQIEGKKDMKARDLPSPDRLDALCISFAYPVVHKRTALEEQLARARTKKRREHNPYENIGQD